MLEFQNLQHRYTPQVEVRFPDLRLAHGDHLLVQGASGSGKSTLLAMIAGLLSPTSGHVRVEGTDVGALRASARDAWRGATLGFVPQRLHLSPSLSVSHNLQLPFVCAGEPVDEARIASVMDHLGIGALAHRRPHELSVGQAHRVALARALLRQPKLILADEPTASLDDDAATDALGLLRQAATETGATLVVATHDRRVTDWLPGAHVLRLDTAPAP